MKILAFALTTLFLNPLQGHCHLEDSPPINGSGVQQQLTAGNQLLVRKREGPLPAAVIKNNLDSDATNNLSDSDYNKQLLRFLQEESSFSFSFSFTYSPAPNAVPSKAINSPTKSPSKSPTKSSSSPTKSPSNVIPSPTKSSAPTLLHRVKCRPRQVLSLQLRVLLHPPRVLQK